MPLAFLKHERDDVYTLYWPVNTFELPNIELWRCVSSSAADNVYIIIQSAKIQSFEMCGHYLSGCSTITSFTQIGIRQSKHGSERDLLGLVRRRSS